MTDIQTSILKVIEEGRQRAQEQPPLQLKPERPKSEPRPRLTLVPYTIIKCLSSLDNIFETRLFGWTLAKAQSVLKLYNKDLSDINIEHALSLTRVTIPARYLLSEGDNNYNNIPRAFSLATKKIVYERDNRLYHLNIIAFPEMVKDGRKSLVTFVIHSELWHALLDFSKGYRLFSLDTYMKLSTKYAVIMYLLISQQSGPRTYGIDALRQILGCDDNRSYERGANFFARVIEPSRLELVEKAPWYFDYSATKVGRTHKYVEIIITPVLNKKVVIDGKSDIAQTGDDMRLRLDDDVKRYIIDKFAMTARECETIEPLLLRFGDKDRQLSKLADIHQRTLSARVKNPAGYLVRALQSSFK